MKRLFFLIILFSVYCYSVSQDNLSVSSQSLAQACELIDKGNMSVNQGNFTNGIQAYSKAKELFYSIGEPDYAIYCDIRLFDIFKIVGDIENLETIGNALTKTYNDWNRGAFEIRDNQVLIMLCETMARIFEIKNMYKHAISQRETLNDVLSMKELEIDDITRANNLYSLSILYQKKSRLEEALRVIDLAISLGDKDEELYVLTRLVKAQILKESGEIGRAINLLAKLEPKVININSNRLRETFYSNYSAMLPEVGRFSEALAIDEKLLSIMEDIYGHNSEYYAIALLNIGEMQGVCNQNQASKESIIGACDVLETLYGRQSALYYYAFNKLVARAEIDEDPNREALKLERLKLAQNVFGEKSKEYAEALIYSVPWSMTPSQNDIENMETAISILREIDLDRSVDYLSYLNWLGLRYNLSKRWAKLYEINNECLSLGKQIVKDSFFNLTGIERKGLWDRINYVISEIPSACGEYTSSLGNDSIHFDFKFHEKYSILAYDALLMQKGLLLSSSIKIKELLEKSDNPAVKQLLSELSYLRNSQDGSKKEIEDCERDLLRYTKEIGNFTDFIEITWREVQKSLAPGEIVIEFYCYPAQDQINYGAVWMSASSSPLSLNLFNSSELKAMSSEESMKSDIVYQCIWRQLDVFHEIKEASTIYFSAAGVLHTLPIEYALMPDGTRYNDTKKVCRLSSTRIIAESSHTPSRQNAVLYGGLRYDVDKEELVAESRGGQYHATSTSRAIDIVNLRYGVNYLPGTLEEVESIANDFNGRCELVTDIAGTEESFKGLAGRSVNLIHLATHGFFWSEEDTKDRSYVSFLNKSWQDKQSFEDRALLRSGLFFSGANIGLRGETLPDDIEDGILTAQELSNMNLGNVDMVVMSACQSGLGETTGEGVFGLQRGFKLAGANTLLMSLWKVDDEATCLLMTEFYKNFLSGKTKQESLYLAQKVLSESDKYSSPKYWAAFILLDALN